MISPYTSLLSLLSTIISDPELCPYFSQHDVVSDGTGGFRAVATFAIPTSTFFVMHLTGSIRAFYINVSYLWTLEPSESIATLRHRTMIDASLDLKMIYKLDSI